jgi:hypothetical protein
MTACNPVAGYQYFVEISLKLHQKADNYLQDYVDS